MHQVGYNRTHLRHRRSRLGGIGAGISTRDPEIFRGGGTRDCLPRLPVMCPDCCHKSGSSLRSRPKAYRFLGEVLVIPFRSIFHSFRA
jgi:hypothetical protein